VLLSASGDTIKWWYQQVVIPARSGTSKLVDISKVMISPKVVSASGDISKSWYYQLAVAASKWIRGGISSRKWWYQQGVASAQGVAAAQRSGTSKG
jgi:hypothetical protein